MKFLILLAWKNLFRYKKRTFITCIAIAVGIAIFIWVDGFMMGFEKDSDKNLMDYETGSAQIINKKYFEEKDYLPLNYTVKNPGAILSILKDNNIPATKRITFGGEIFFGEGSRQMKVFGIDLETVNNVYRLDNDKLYVENSRKLAAGRNEIIIGEWLTEDLGIKMGATVEIRTRTKHGAYTTLTLTVAGIINTENPIVNKSCAFIPLDVANSALQMNGEVTDISVRFDEWKDLDKEVERVSGLISADYPDLVTKSYIDLFGGGGIMESKRSVINVMMFLVFVIATVGIANTMLIAVYERIREIGMMRALGMKDSGIRITFMFESIGIGLFGSIFGVILGSLLNAYTYFIGFDITGLIGRMDFGYRMVNIFKSTWNPGTMVLAFIIGPLIAILVSMIPSSKALKMEVTDCLRYQ
ncbi:MAG: ABC transporter permease [Spirochaetales bacterium]|nr:ABC transporter permease [Spirochaetales bacterium]